jgi:FtsH-binding integral membrane protein
MTMNFDATPAAMAQAEARATFLSRTYTHLLGAILAFAGLEALLLGSPVDDAMTRLALSGRFGWLLVLGGFMLVSYVAERWARDAASQAMQYAGLGLYVLLEALLFLPLLHIAALRTDQNLISSAAIITAIVFTGLTLIVFMTRMNFSFLRGVLYLAGFAAMGLIAASMLFGLSLGVWFSWGMIAFSAGWILYKTSSVLHDYRTDQHVSAALGLFASVALLFWYVLQLLMSRRN